MERIPTNQIIREIPEDSKIIKTINGIKIYNLNIFQNIMSWNKHNLDVTAYEYFGNKITYGQLPKMVDEYALGFEKMGIKKDTVITMSMPSSIEYFSSLFAASNMGAISNNVNFLFLRNNLKKYTQEKNSDTLIILDIYLPLIAKQIKNTGIKNIVLTSLSDYLPEEIKDYFSDLGKLPEKIREKLVDKDYMSKCIDEIKSLKGVNFIKMSEVIKEGKDKSRKIVYPKVDINKDSIYSYTSGTTADPKCIVFKEYSPNAIIEMHNGIDMRDYVGDRSLVVIPPSHATGMFYATYLQMAKAKTLVIQPIYDKNTFAKDLKELDINHTLAAASFYLAAVANGDLGKNALSKLNRPCSGGEAISKSNVQLINEWLSRNGASEKLSIGGGAGEIGSSALTSYDLDPITKTNETGYPIPGVYVKLVDSKTGLPVKKGDRGIIHISSAASADRYLNNVEATNDYFYYDENNLKWANLGDLAKQNENGSYNMLGRDSDSYVDSQGKKNYLFDTEYALEIDDPVIEWEISAFKSSEKEYDKVAQIVLKPDFIGRESDVITQLCDKYKLNGVKIYDSFGVSEVTGKRNYTELKNDKKDYLCPYDDETFMRKTYIDNSMPIIEYIDKSEVNTNIKSLIKK